MDGERRGTFKATESAVDKFVGRFFVLVELNFTSTVKYLGRNFIQTLQG